MDGVCGILRAGASRVSQLNDADGAGRSLSRAWEKRLGAAAAIVTIALAFTQDRPITILVLAGSICLAAALRTYSVLKGSRHRPRGRSFRFRVIGVWCVAAVLAAIVFSVDTTRHAVVYDVLGFHRLNGAPVVKVVSVRVLWNSRFYDLVATVGNDSRTQAFVTTVALRVQSSIGPPICFAYPYQFVVGPTLDVIAGPSGQQLPVTAAVQESGLAGVHEAAAGQISGRCTDQELALSFPTSVVVPPGGYSSLVIKVPRRFRVVRDESPPVSQEDANGQVRVIHLPKVSMVDVELPSGVTGWTGNHPGGYLLVQLTVAGQAHPASKCIGVPRRWLRGGTDPCAGIQPPI